MARPFRILSLSGGGVRGVFQAVFLQRLEQRLNIALRHKFDMVAGTSTGAILALGIALEVSVDRLLDFYREKSADIFEHRRLAGITRGPRYNQDVLRDCLTEVFGNKQLHDAKQHVVITASSLDQFNHRVFTSAKDGALRAVDVALASAAGPTYFAPVKPVSEERSYADGGLWANTPALVALFDAQFRLGRALSDIRLLALGNGYVPEGRLPLQVATRRPLSLSWKDTVLDLMWRCQASYAHETAGVMLPDSQYRNVDVPLPRKIDLDDVKGALGLLPALAEKAAADFIEHAGAFFAEEEDAPSALPTYEVPPALVRDLLPAAGMTAFYPSRDYYATHRRDAARIDLYVAQAQKTLVMVSINLMTGVPFNDLCEALRRKLESERAGFRVTISLLDPANEHLMEALAPSLPMMTAAKLADSINGTLTELWKLKKDLAGSAQERFTIRVHRSIPFGSAILLDHREPSGRIQIETKVYKAGFQKSFAFEIVPGGSSGMYEVLAKGYEELIKDGGDVSQEDVLRAASSGR